MSNPKASKSASKSATLQRRPQPRTAKRVWTASEEESINASVDVLKDLLGLHDWIIDFDPCAVVTTEASATMESYPHQRRAALTLDPEVRSYSPQDKLFTLVHELYHCHLLALHTSVSTLIEATFDPTARVVADLSINERIEEATDDIAIPVARLIERLEVTIPFCQE